MSDNRHRLVNAIIEAVRPQVDFVFHATNLDMSSDGVVYVGSMLTFNKVDPETVRLYDMMEGDCIGTLRLLPDGSGFRFVANTATFGLTPSELMKFKNLLYAAWEKEMAIKKELEKDA